jgi:hypothetical protein
MEESQESSMFVFKLGVAKLQCCLLMNGLVFDSNEVLLKFILSATFSFKYTVKIVIMLSHYYNLSAREEHCRSV